MNNDGPEGENFSALSIEDRLEHKSWRARVSAYEQISKEFARADGPKSSIFREYMDCMRKAPAESNAAALDAALSALHSFIANASEDLIIK